LGYTQADVLGKSAFELLHPEDAPKLMAHFGESLQNPDTSGSVECRIRHKDGSWRYMEAQGRVYTDEHGESVILVSSRDVTDRKQGELLLREKERLLSEAQRIGRIGSWSYDIPNDAMTFSDEMYRLLDILPEDFHHDSKDFLALVYPSDRPNAARWMADIKEATQEKDLNFRIFHKNGELCYLHCTGVVEFDDFARPVRFIGTAQDVSERRAAEMQIDQQIKRLTALSEIDRAIISSLDQRYTLGVILSQIISQLQVDAVDVLIVDSEGEELKYTVGQGFRTNTRETAQLRLGEGHAGRAAKERRMIRIPDLRETTNDLAFSRLVIAEDFVSYIAVPLIVKGKVRGVLEVFQRSLLQPYQEWLEFFHTLAGQTAIAIESTSLFANLQASNEELIQAYEATIEGWSRAMDLRDRETEGHTQRVTKLTLELAGSMGIDDLRLTHIRRGALLHDIGKLGVPDHILFKASSLTIEERQIMEQHVDFAYEMLAPISYLKPALNIPYFHHEKWDGTGYPLGLKGEQIPLEARIFALVDVWDALLSDRPYRKAWTRERTIEYIRSQSGAHFDPRVVECFLEIINKIA
jgi:PAS domain S-box-containing protein/putative nucleotidyltransferase with HDIG domain